MEEIEADSENFYINCNVPRKQSIREQLENLPVEFFEFPIPASTISITIGCIDKGFVVVNNSMSNLCDNLACPSCMGLKNALVEEIKNYLKN